MRIQWNCKKIEPISNWQSSTILGKGDTAECCEPMVVGSHAPVPEQCARERASKRGQGSTQPLADLIQTWLVGKVLQGTRVNQAVALFGHDRKPTLLPPCAASYLGGGLLLKPALKLDKNTVAPTRRWCRLLQCVGLFLCARHWRNSLSQRRREL
eukprot:COSAG02_NODE_22113_length_763_cov_0.783133_2_plen_155_part_00